jgi:hypothetical protein
MSFSPNYMLAETPAESTKIFNIFGLSQELRDMIYDQPEMLEDESLHTSTRWPDSSQIIGTKPRTNLRLVCKRLDGEYMARCEGRKRLFVKTDIYTYSECPKTWSAEAIKQVNIVHFHFGVWGSRTQRVQDLLKELKYWLTRQCSRMSRLRAVSITPYVAFSAHHLTPSDLEVWLLSLSSLEKMEKLYVVEMPRTESKRLLIHWERKDRQPPQINYPAAEHTKPCCGDMLTECEAHVHKSKHQTLHDTYERHSTSSETEV